MRITKPSAEGTLGVEGMDREILTEAFRRAGVLELQEKPFAGSPVTPALLYDHGLMGTPDCTLRRRALLEAMQLPPRLSVSGLCEVLSTMTCAEQLSEFLQSYLPDDGGAACS